MIYVCLDMLQKQTVSERERRDGRVSWRTATGFVRVCEFAVCAPPGKNPIAVLLLVGVSVRGFSLLLAVRKLQLPSRQL